jgi:hypothetical protein
MTLIMPKQKAVFFFTVAAQQQQVSVTPLNIQHYEFSCRCRAAEYQKVFSSGISTNIDRKVVRPDAANHPASILQVGKADSCAHLCEGTFKRVHNCPQS